MKERVSARKIATSWVSNLTQRQSRKYRRPCQMYFTSGFNNSRWHTSYSGNDSREGRRVLWRKILVGIVDTQLYLLARSIEELYWYNQLMSVCVFLYFMDLLESLHFQDWETYEVKLAYLNGLNWFIVNKKNLFTENHIQWYLG